MSCDDLFYIIPYKAACILLKVITQNTASHATRWSNATMWYHANVWSSTCLHLVDHDQAENKTG